MVKTPEEIRRLRRATEITIKAHASFRDAIKVGNTDHDLFKAATGRMISEGADGIRSSTSVAGRQTLSRPRALPDGTVMKRATS